MLGHSHCWAIFRQMYRHNLRDVSACENKYILLFATHYFTNYFDYLLHNDIHEHLFMITYPLNYAYKSRQSIEQSNNVSFLKGLLKPFYIRVLKR